MKTEFADRELRHALDQIRVKAERADGRIVDVETLLEWRDTIIAWKTLAQGKLASLEARIEALEAKVP
jgi:hypothetical protein